MKIAVNVIWTKLSSLSVGAHYTIFVVANTLLFGLFVSFGGPYPLKKMSTFDLFVTVSVIFGPFMTVLHLAVVLVLGKLVFRIRNTLIALYLYLLPGNAFHSLITEGMHPDEDVFLTALFFPSVAVVIVARAIEFSTSPVSRRDT